MGAGRHHAGQVPSEESRHGRIQDRAGDSRAGRQLHRRKNGGVVEEIGIVPDFKGRRITVSDNGHGMETDELAAGFLPQSRVTVQSRAPHHPLPAMLSRRFRMDLNGVMRRKTPAPPGAVESPGFAEGIVVQDSSRNAGSAPFWPDFAKNASKNAPDGRSWGRTLPKTGPKPCHTTIKCRFESVFWGTIRNFCQSAGVAGGI